MIRSVVLLLLLFLALPAAAQTAIHRCVAADGNPVFTDQPCTSVGATSVMPMPAAASSTLGDLPDGPSAGLLCAKDLAELRQGVAQAFASRSANRIGGLILWNGYGSAGAVDNLRSMEALVRQPLVSLEGSAEGGIDAVTSGPGGDGSTRRAHFGVVRDSGCLWLRPPA